MTLSAETEMEGDLVELPPHSRVHKQPQVDIGPSDYDRKTAKQKVKVKKKPGLKVDERKTKTVYYLPAP